MRGRISNFGQSIQWLPVAEVLVNFQKGGLEKGVDLLRVVTEWLRFLKRLVFIFSGMVITKGVELGLGSG